MLLFIKEGNKVDWTIKRRHTYRVGYGVEWAEGVWSGGEVRVCGGHDYRGCYVLGGLANVSPPPADVSPIESNSPIPFSLSSFGNFNYLHPATLSGKSQYFFSSLKTSSRPQILRVATLSKQFQ